MIRKFFSRIKWMNTLSVVLLVLALAAGSYAVFIPALAVLALVLAIGSGSLAIIGLQSE